MMLEDGDVFGAGFLRGGKLGFQPLLLLGGESDDVRGRLDEIGVQNNSLKISVVERVMVRAEKIGVGGDHSRRRNVSNIVIAGDVVDGNRWIDCGEDAFEFLDLGGIADFVYEVAGDNNESGMQTIDGGDGKFEICGFLH